MIDLFDETHSQEILKQRKEKYGSEYGLKNSYILTPDNFLFFVSYDCLLFTCDPKVVGFPVCVVDSIAEKYNVKYITPIEVGLHSISANFGLYKNCKKFLDTVFDNVNTQIFQFSFESEAELEEELKCRGLL